MKKWLGALFIVVALMLVACGSDNAATDDDSEADVTNVEELVKSNCATCHSGDGDLDAGSFAMSEEEMIDIIVNGVGSMPAIEVTNDEATLIAE